MFNTSITNSQALIGGAISLMCGKIQSCKYTIRNNIFRDNLAIDQGGAIYYSKYRPDFMLDNQYINNLAVYGQNYASFPYSVQLLKYDQIEVASGQKYNGQIEVALIDPDVKDNLEQCQDCLDHTICPGGYLIDVNQGYWRKSFFDTQIHKCIEASACIGGMYSLNNQEDKSNYPLCAEGYEGNLCNRCQIKGDKIYSRSGVSKCEECPNPLQNILLLQSILLAVMAYMLFMIVTNLREDSNQEASAILRILTNFLQIISSTSLIDLQWPETLKSFYRAFSILGETSSRLISFDCFVFETILKNDSNSLVYFKTLLIGVLPIALIIVFLIFTFIIILIRGMNFQTFKKWSIVSIVVIIYFLHPQITKYIFQLFYCINLEGTDYLFQDMQVECWTGDHLKYSLVIGMPFLIFWVFLAPIIAFGHLQRNKNQLQQPLFKQKYQTLYLGLKEKCFYWEFINISRKVFLVAVNIFLQTQADFFKALLTLMIIIMLYALLVKLKPYKNPLINTLEQREFQCSIVTFFGALFFLSEDIEPIIKICVFVVIILFISWFLILWLYCILYCQKSPFLRKTAKFIRIMTLLSQSEAELLNISNIEKEYIKQQSDLQKSNQSHFSNKDQEIQTVQIRLNLKAPESNLNINLRSPVREKKAVKVVNQSSKETNSMSEIFSSNQSNYAQNNKRQQKSSKNDQKMNFGSIKGDSNVSTMTKMHQKQSYPQTSPRANDRKQIYLVNHNQYKTGVEIVELPDKQCSEQRQILSKSEKAKNIPKAINKQNKRIYFNQSAYGTNNLFSSNNEFMSFYNKKQKNDQQLNSSQKMELSQSTKQDKTNKSLRNTRVNQIIQKYSTHQSSTNNKLKMSPIKQANKIDVHRIKSKIITIEENDLED
eukprot:403361082